MERPILFSGPMVRAILENKKTMTRRVVRRTIANRVKAVGSIRNFHIQDPHVVQACPYGVPGDLLWVREAWALTDQAGDHITDARVVYRATDQDWETMEGWKWRPSIFMPRWAARIWLRIVSVRVERLQQITGEDAYREGCEYRNDFPALWDELNAKRGVGWETNPWVWVIEFALDGVGSVLSVKQEA